MSGFIKGLDLCRQFFFEVAKPILDQNYPNLCYSAGLLGNGSDILGFDDETSTDHMWGPRFYLFLRDSDLPLKEDILRLFSKEFPYEYKGYSVNFSFPNPKDHGVRMAEKISTGPVSPLVFIHTIEDYLNSYLGTSQLDTLTAADWLSFSEHRLLTLTSATFFVDELKIQNLLSKIHFYPKEVQKYLIASNWSLIAEEQAFVKRCSDVDDEIGSIFTCSRIAERLMRLAFLYCNQYAPYSKWFGTAFKKLPIDPKLRNCIYQSVIATDIQQRETNLVLAQKLMADWHNSLGLSEFVDIKIESYFSRNIKVIFADKLSRATAKELQSTQLENLPLIGTMSEISNFAALTEQLPFRSNIKDFYRSFSTTK